jgi:hypothetical protein
MMRFGRFKSGRVKVRKSVDFPEVSDKWIGDTGIIVPLEADFDPEGLFEPSTYRIEANGSHYRIWIMTAAGEMAFRESKAA